MAAAEAIAKRGDTLHTVAAVETSTSSIVGFSELVFPGEVRSDTEGEGQHYGTAVLPEHRGMGWACG